MGASARLRVLFLAVLGAVICTSCYIYIDDGEDRYRNYDYDRNLRRPDWPITVVFVGPNLTEASVNDLIHAIGYPWSSGELHLFLRDSPTGGSGQFHWDGDGGRKNEYIGPCGDFWHMRIYKDNSGVALYNNARKNYVLATTHRDLNDGGGCSGKKHYLPEGAANHIINKLAETNFVTTLGGSICRDCYELTNSNDTSDNYNDGRADVIYVPKQPQYGWDSVLAAW